MSKSKFKLTKQEKAWIKYDIGNSAFVLLIATLIPIYFNSLAESAGVSSTDYLAYWGYAGSISTLIVAFIAPIFGTLADRKNRKKPLFVTFLLLGALGCCALGVTQSWLGFLIVFIVAKVGYSSSLVFYDAMLPEITDSKRVDKVSANGYAYGYIGSVIPFVICLLLVLFGEKIGLSQKTAMILSFIITSVWWIIFSIPVLRCYKQRAFVETKKGAAAETFVRLWNTLKNIKKHKKAFLFLLSFFFFIDGVYTIIDMATAYGTALGLDTTGLLLALLVTQIVAFPFAIIFGRLSSRYDTGKLIKFCIVAYTFITLFAVTLTYQWQFWVLAVAVGMFQGGIQALSRSYFAKIIPVEQSGEYFGIYDICGKGASFIGTSVVAVITQYTNNEKLGVGALVVIFIIGFFLFCRADSFNDNAESNKQ